MFTFIKSLRAKALIAGVAFALALWFFIMHVLNTSLRPLLKSEKPATPADVSSSRPAGTPTGNALLNAPVKQGLLVGTSPRGDSTGAAVDSVIAHEAEKLCEPFLRSATERETKTREVLYDGVNQNGYQCFIVKFDSLTPQEVLVGLDSIKQRIERLDFSYEEKEEMFQIVSKRLFERADPAYPFRFLMVDSKADGSIPAKGTYIQSMLDSPFMFLPSGGVATKVQNTSRRFLKEDKLRQSYSHLVGFGN